jgi:hypothetical protein
MYSVLPPPALSLSCLLSRGFCSVSGGTGTKQDESSTGRVWPAGFHQVAARSRLARVLKLMNRLFFYFPNFFRAAVNRGHWINGYGGTALYSTECTWRLKDSGILRRIDWLDCLIPKIKVLCTSIPWYQFTTRQTCTFQKTSHPRQPQYLTQDT